MTSVRPKLKPETPKAITAWNTITGKSVWMTQVGTWSEDAQSAAAFTGEVAEARLGVALQQEHLVTDPYFMEVTDRGGITGRETIRETIRATGPTVAYGDAA